MFNQTDNYLEIKMLNSQHFTQKDPKSINIITDVYHTSSSLATLLELPVVMVKADITGVEGSISFLT